MTTLSFQKAWEVESMKAKVKKLISVGKEPSLHDNPKLAGVCVEEGASNQKAIQSCL